MKKNHVASVKETPCWNSSPNTVSGDIFERINDEIAEEILSGISKIIPKAISEVISSLFPLEFPGGIHGRIPGQTHEEISGGIFEETRWETHSLRN